MFNRESLTRLLLSVFVAAVITLFALFVSSEYYEAALCVLKGMGVGAVIWLLGELLFSMCEKLFPRSIVPGYVVLVFLILLGTAGFGYLLGIADIVLLAGITFAAEACGLGITVFYRKKYSHALNERLARSKTKLEQGRHPL